MASKFRKYKEKTRIGRTITWNRDANAGRNILYKGWCAVMNIELHPAFQRHVEKKRRKCRRRRSDASTTSTSSTIKTSSIQSKSTNNTTNIAFSSGSSAELSAVSPGFCAGFQRGPTIRYNYV
ncbi:uncharacterized protein LOC116346565 [Contarinia nasturtii]|uniref:uncharacterized protein LOC116346565 n=1 Tax=Contarinia nasturtii TaxID=265458 RepID=UPI0012D3A835|nr:uncharacterized protein LOC116346565 [Contarinia nasturtii]